MNERIKELANQAGLKVEAWMTNPPQPFQILGSTGQFEKFAELIIAECINSITVWRDAKDELMDNEPHWQGYTSGCDDSIVEIQQRFGIKNE